MNLPQYKTNPDEDLHSFSFISEGKNGKIEKVIRYEKITNDVFNLGFGDKDSITGKINDKVVTNNGDTEKVLATVVLTIFMFTDKYPDAYIFATGSTPARTRLYRRSIFKFIEEAKENFNLYGVLDDQQTEVFIPNKDYKGFVIQRKKL